MDNMYHRAEQEGTKKVVETTATFHNDGTLTVKKKETTETVPCTRNRLPTTTETAPTRNVLALGWK